MKPTYNDLVELLATRDQELAALRKELKESREREAALRQEVAALRQELEESRKREAALRKDLEESCKREAARDQEIATLKEEFKAMANSTADLIKQANTRYLQNSWHDIVNALNTMHANMTLLPPPPTCSGHALM